MRKDNSEKKISGIFSFRAKSVVIANRDYLQQAQNLNSKSFQLIMADWPFLKGTISKESLKMFKNGVREASRLLSSDGNFVSLNYPIPSIHIAIVAKKYGLEVVDSIPILRHQKYKFLNRLGFEWLNLLVFIRKGCLHKRILVGDQKLRGGIYWKKGLVPGDFWSGEYSSYNDTSEKKLRFPEFAAGYRVKDRTVNVPEAMSRFYVRKILDTWAVPGISMFDFFGGCGNFPLECIDRNVYCLATELDYKRFIEIKRRIKALKSCEVIEAGNKIDDLEMLSNKALESINTSYTKELGVHNGWRTAKLKEQRQREAHS